MKVNFNNKLFTEEELQNTPIRIKRFFEEWSNNKIFNFTIFDSHNYNEMIILKDIEFASMCSHHLLPFHGKAHIGYIPNNKICGISKLARTVDMFASKPQAQERLTEQIVDFLMTKLNPKGVMLVMEAAHDCMRIRGVKKQNSIMITSAIRGVFEKQEVREEFLRLIK
jgi:GTP cyclohydrolase I